MFENVFAFYKRKVFYYKNDQDDRDKNQDQVLTFETIYEEVSKITNAPDLKKLVVAHHDNMKNNEIFAQVKSEEAKRIILDAIEVMDSQLMKIQTAKPTISFGVNNESSEELIKRWDEQIDSTINELKIEIKDPVKNLEFQLSRPTDFDSMILSNDPRSKKMVADWVLETIKSNHCQLNLLYRGSRDGFQAKNFHEKCDNRGPTVVLIENTTENKFGGYAAVSWMSNGNDIKNEESKRSFLFSVDKKQKLLYKLKCDMMALYHSLAYGPAFGNALFVRGKFNEKNGSGCISESYEDLKEGGLISGTHPFTVKEIEVYSIEFI